MPPSYLQRQSKKPFLPIETRTAQLNRAGMIDNHTNYDSKVVLITGGLGFIGSNLAIRLAEFSKAEIRIIDSLHPACGGNPNNLDGIARPVQYNKMDLREVSKLRKIISGVDVIFNLAGHVSHTDSMKHPLEDFGGNAEANLCLLECCRNENPGVRIVYSSTRQCYGRPQRLPVDETHPILPLDINGVNKYAAELYHRIYYQAHGLQTCSLRLTNTYGPRQLIRTPSQGVVGWLIYQILCNQEIVLFGNGKQVRDLTYVDCVVDALLLAGKHPGAPGKTFNLGSEEPVTLIDLVELMISIYGKGSYRFAPFPEEMRKIDIGDYYGSFSRIREELGWRPQVSLREGIRRTFDFFGRRISANLSHETSLHTIP
jgi:UDP-glucose 4-epimerase